MNTLEYIKNILGTKSAIEYANYYLLESKATTNLRDIYSNNENDSNELVEDRCFCSGLRRYNEMLSYYKGFIENGSVFVLNKKEKFVLFIAETKNDRLLLVTHYNPLDVDCITESIHSENFYTCIEDGIYEISKNEEQIIQECDNLIN